jgi:hypothetical protein
LVRFEKSDGTTSYTDSVVGAGFSSLLVSFVLSDMTVAAATGATADALVVIGWSSDDVFLSEASK